MAGSASLHSLPGHWRYPYPHYYSSVCPVLYSDCPPHGIYHKHQDAGSRKAAAGNSEAHHRDNNTGRLRQRQLFFQDIQKAVRNQPFRVSERQRMLLNTIIFRNFSYKVKIVIHRRSGCPIVTSVENFDRSTFIKFSLFEYFFYMISNRRSSRIK